MAAYSSHLQKSSRVLAKLVYDKACLLFLVSSTRREGIWPLSGAGILHPDECASSQGWRFCLFTAVTPTAQEGAWDFAGTQ